MNFRRDTQQQFPGSGLLGVYALLLAVSQIVLDRQLKFGAQLGNCFAMGADDGANAEDAPCKDTVTLVIPDASGVALLGHGVHCCTPVRSSSSRTSST
jgi:hypothetical protein